MAVFVHPRAFGKTQSSGRHSDFAVPKRAACNLKFHPEATYVRFVASVYSNQVVLEASSDWLMWFDHANISPLWQSFRLTGRVKVQHDPQCADIRNIDADNCYAFFDSGCEKFAGNVCAAVADYGVQTIGMTQLSSVPLVSNKNGNVHTNHKPSKSDSSFRILAK